MHKRSLRLARGAEKELVSVGALLLLTIALALVFPGLITLLPVLLLLLVWGLLLYFFRDPRRTPPTDTDAILSPADGCVMEVQHVHEPRFLDGEALKVSIFMSLLDVHVNRAPLDGRVALIEHVAGEFRQAFRPEASQVNEHNLIGLESRYGRVLVVQIAGILARRIVCWVAPGQELSAGERLGVIKFGSRVEVYLPPEMVTAVSVGEQVYAGTTVIARCVAKEAE